MTRAELFATMRGALVGAAVAWAAIDYPASVEYIPSEEESTQTVAYTLGVAEGARVEALKHCACDTKRYLGAPCPPAR